MFWMEHVLELTSAKMAVYYFSSRAILCKVCSNFLETCGTWTETCLLVPAKPTYHPFNYYTQSVSIFWFSKMVRMCIPTIIWTIWWQSVIETHEHAFVCIIYSKTCFWMLNSPQSASHHLIIDHFPFTAHQIVLYLKYSTFLFHLKSKKHYIYLKKKN